MIELFNIAVRSVSIITFVYIQNYIIRHGPTYILKSDSLDKVNTT